MPAEYDHRVQFLVEMDSRLAEASISHLDSKIMKSMMGWKKASLAFNRDFMSPPASFAQFKNNLKRLKQDLNSVERTAKYTGTITGKALKEGFETGEIALDRLEGKMAKVVKRSMIAQQIDGLSKKWISLGKNTQWLGRQLMVGLTLPIVAFGAKAVKAFEQVNDEYVRLAKVLDNNELHLVPDVKDAVRKLSGYYGFSEKMLAALASDWAALGYRAKDLQGAIKGIANTAILGDMQDNLSGASEFFRSVLAIFVQGQEGINNTAAAFKRTSEYMANFNMIENKTSINLKDLAIGFPIVASSARLMGLSANETAAALATLKKKGVDASEAANGLKFILTRIIAPTKEAKKAFAGVLDLEGIGTGLPALTKIANVLGDLNKPNPQAAQMLSKLVGNRQIGRATMLLQSIKEFNKELIAAHGNIGELEKSNDDFARAMAAAVDKEGNLKQMSQEIGIVLHSPQQELRKLKANFNIMLAEIGEVLMPKVIKAMEIFNKILRKIVDMPAPFKSLITGAAVFLAAMGPIIFIFGQMTLASMSLVDGLNKVNKLFAKKNEIGLAEQMAKLKGVFVVVGGQLVEFPDLYKVMEKAQNEVIDVTEVETASHEANAAAMNAEAGAVGRLTAAKMAAFNDTKGSAAESLAASAEGDAGGILANEEKAAGQRWSALMQYKKRRKAIANRESGVLADMKNNWLSPKGLKGGAAFDDLADEFGTYGDPETWLTDRHSNVPSLPKKLGPMHGPNPIFPAKEMKKSLKQQFFMADDTKLVPTFDKTRKRFRSVFIDFPKGIGEKLKGGLGKVFGKLDGFLAPIKKGFAAEGLTGGLKGGIGGLVTSFSELLPLVLGTATAIGAFVAAAAAIGAVVYVIVQLAKHWKEISSRFGPGIKAIKAAWEEVKQAVAGVVKIFSDALSNLFGGTDKASDKAQLWTQIGDTIASAMKIAAGALRWVAKVIQWLAPFWKWLADIVANAVGLIFAIFSGDWKKIWDFAVNIFIDEFMVPFAAMMDAMVHLVVIAAKKILSMMDSVGNKVGGFIKKIPGLKSVGKALQNVGNGLIDGLDRIDKAFDPVGLLEQIKTHPKFEVDPKPAKEAGAHVAHVFVKGVEEGLDKEKPQAKQDTSDFLNALKDEVTDQMNQFKKKAQDAFEKAMDLRSDKFDAQQKAEADNLEKEGKRKVSVYDKQIAKINALNDADEKRYAKEEYLQRKREMLTSMALNREIYLRNRAFAIYEGRINDARMLDLDHIQDETDNKRQLSDLEKQRHRDIVKDERDAQVKKLEAAKAGQEKINDAEKAALEKRQATQKKIFEQNQKDWEQAFNDQLDIITKYAPRNAAEFQAMLDNINGLLVSFGAPGGVFQNSGEQAMGAFKQAILYAQKDLVEAAKWVGTKVGNAMGDAASAALKKNGVFGGSHDVLTNNKTGVMSIPGVGVQAGIGGRGSYDPMWNRLKKFSLKRSLFGGMGGYKDKLWFLNPSAKKRTTAQQKLYDLAYSGALNIGLLQKVAAGHTSFSLATIEGLVDGSWHPAGPLSKNQMTFLHALGLPGFAKGGMVPGASDTIPAMLSPGEFVLTKDAVKKLGAKSLDQINEGKNLFKPNMRSMKDFYNKLPSGIVKWFTAKFPESSSKISEMWSKHWAFLGKDSEDLWGNTEKVIEDKLTKIKENVNDETKTTRKLGAAQWIQYFEDNKLVWGKLSGNIFDKLKFIYNIVKDKTKDTVNTGNDHWTTFKGQTKITWTQIHDSIKDTVNGITNTLGGAGDKWGGKFKTIRKAFGSPVNFVITDIMNKFFGELNKFTDTMGMGKLFKKMKITKFHRGGVVGEGKDTKNMGDGLGSDEQLAVLKKGEGVIPNSAMKKMGRKGFKSMLGGEGFGAATGGGGMSNTTEIESKFLAAVKQHESGGNYQAQTPMGSASGAYQIIDSTWGGYGGYKHAKDAPPNVQDMKALMMVRAFEAITNDPRLWSVGWYGGSGMMRSVMAGKTPWSTEPNKGLSLKEYADWIINYMGMATIPNAPASGTQPFKDAMLKIFNKAIGKNKGFGQMMEKINKGIAFGSMVKSWGWMDNVLKWVNAATGGITPGGSAGHGVPGNIASWMGKEGSDEELIRYMSSTGVPYFVMSQFRPGAVTRTGHASYHSMHRAVDFGDPAAGGNAYDSPGLMNIWKSFQPVKQFLRELIYAGAPTYIGGGVEKPINMLRRDIFGDHHNHVHAALAGGGIVRHRRGGTLVRAGEGFDDEIVSPLPKFNINNKFDLPKLIGDSMGAVISKMGENPGGFASTYQTVHLHVDTFVGQEEWFNELQEEYKTGLGAATQRSLGVPTRRVSSYKNNVVRYR